MTAATTAQPDAATTASSARPRWERPAVAVLLTATAVLYLWRLGASGYANDYYAAAVQAGTQSWTAFLFGGLDAGGAITVDKPPASLWVMALSARIFGFNSWSILIPQALMGVATVALLHTTVRRWSGPSAGLFAAAAFALTPVTVLMFRFNNPDALLVLLTMASAYCVVRACETASTGWLAMAGAAVGFAFLTKMLQAFLVVPAFALVYLIAAPAPLRRRLWQLLVAGATLVTAAGWWVAVVALWPAGSRPYIGGSTTNSALQLAIGYNGMARISSEEGPGQGGGPAPFSSGIARIFAAGVGEQVAWLLPAALVALVLGLVLTRRVPRTDTIRAGLLLWGGWLLVSGVVFTLMRGKFHAYYTVSMVPAIGAVLAITGQQLWRTRNTWTGRGGLAALTATCGGWAFVLLARTRSWHPELRYLVAVATVAATVALLAGSVRAVRAGMVASLAAALLGPAGSAAATAAAPHRGSDPTAGPAVARDRAGTGKPGSRSAVDATVVNALRATTTRWAAATSGAQSAAPLALASGRPVIGIGGFTGIDPAPTLAQFQTYVANGQITYFVAGGLEEGKIPRGGGTGTGQQITTWVAATFTPTKIGSIIVYQLTGSAR